MDGPARSTAARVDRALNVAGGAVLLALVLGTTWSFVAGRHRASAGVDATHRSPALSPIAAIGAALTNPSAPTASYLTEAALKTLVGRVVASQRGVSGRLRAAFEARPTGIRPDTLPSGGQLLYASGSDTTRAEPQPTTSGVWRVLLEIGNAVRPIADFSLITMLPFTTKRDGRIGSYYLGTWPAERGLAGPPKAPADRYANPTGFIEVTQANEDTYVSQHFRLRDFLTHDQPNVWPKYLVLQPRLLDKLELVLADLESRGYVTAGVHVMSGFRTPQYNYTGGNTEGRAELSRHMYGDAADIFIDNTGSGEMNDLNHDGRIDIDDARVILASVDRVEAAHPELVGGAGTYAAAPGHGPFIHIDTRGYRARW